MRLPTRPIFRGAVLVVVLLVAGMADAQYFGRNKVQWEKFDFKILKTEHFDLYYYPELEPSIAEIGRMAERWNGRLSKVFDHQLSDRKPIVLYANHPDFQQTTTTGGLIGEGTGGFTDPFQNRIVMPLTGTLAETDHVLGHEMVHVFQFDIASSLMAEGGQRFRLQLLPLWMIEGLAEYYSQGRVDPQTTMWMRDAMLHERLPDLDDLNRNPRYSPYQFGQAVWAYIGGRWDDRTVVNLFVAAGTSGVEQAFDDVLGSSAKEVFAAWHESIEETQEPPKFRKAGVERLGDAMLRQETTGANLNVAPSLSPDGRWVAFLSTRDLFSVDLFLADALTGKVIKRLVSASADPHLDALRFIDSSGTWSPDSKKFAFVVFEKGDNKIAIVDVATRSIERRIIVAGVGSLSNPAWSPDGRSIAFSGMVGGVTDIFLLDVGSEKVDRLTTDPWGDLQPAWSPDGRTLAFVSERGAGSDLPTLRYAPLQIALLDVASREVRTLNVFDGATHINPQFSPDGANLFFVADPDGVPDVFRYEIERDRTYRVTAVDTGVAGITLESPSLSVAPNSGHMMFSVFNDAKWSIFKLDPERTDGELIEDVVVSRSPLEVLPPLPAAETETIVAEYLADPTEGLPDSPDFARSTYRPKLRLDYIGPPAIGVGVDRYGLGLGGSISAYFSDVLGRHQVGISFEGGTSSDIGTLFGGQVFYLNRVHRWNWGGILTHIPYISAATSFRTGTREIDGQIVPVNIAQQLRQTVTIDELSAIAQYPFGQTRRIEGSVGYTRLGYDAEIETLVYTDTAIIENTIENVPTIPDFDYMRGSIALIGDSSTYGFISPVRGTRYRFELEQNTGDIDFFTGLADYRKYWFRRPVTLAVRGIHYGRYGDDAEDSRLNALYVGRDTLVRGYEVGDISLAECVSPDGSNRCPVFDRLVGSKIGVVNVELRAPLFGPKGYGFFEVPFLPTEMALFIDGGVAWTEDESPKLKFDQNSLERVPVFSAGVAARILLGGFFPIQLYYAAPFQRPKEDWVFGITIATGW